MKTQVNKATVDTAKETKINNNHLLSRKEFCFNPLSANPTKQSNILKQFVGILPTNGLSVFDHFVILALKGLRKKPFTMKKMVLLFFVKLLVNN